MMLRKASKFAVLALFVGGVAHASPIVVGQIDTFTESNYHSWINGECCFTVTLTQVSTAEVGVDVSLSKLNSTDPTPLWAETGGPHVGFGFDLDKTVSMSNIDSPWAAGNETLNTPDGTGKYSDQIDNGWENGTNGHFGGDLTFDLSVSSGTLSFQNFLDPNGYYFEADILGNSSTGEGYIVCPGLVSTPRVTPEPSSLFLLGTGILGAGLLVRRRMHAPAA